MMVEQHAHSHQHHTDDRVGLVLHNPIRYDFRVWLTTRGREGKFRRTLVELAGVKPGDSVLDIGCGTGSLAIEAGKTVGPTGSVDGIDPSPEMIGRAKGKARRLANVRFEIAPAQNLPFADASFDIVMSSLVLHQLPPDSLHTVKAEVARVLKPGGRLLLVDIGGDQQSTHTPHARAAKRHGVHLFDLRKIGPTLASVGLKELANGDVPFKLFRFERVQYVLAEKS
jgi:ubiquinone/menaquinone biosynthesis C-methylase UbiE